MERYLRYLMLSWSEFRTMKKSDEVIPKRLFCLPGTRLFEFSWRPHGRTKILYFSLLSCIGFVFRGLLPENKTWLRNVLRDLKKNVSSRYLITSFICLGDIARQSKKRRQNEIKLCQSRPPPFLEMFWKTMLYYMNTIIDAGEGLTNYWPVLVIHAQKTNCSLVFESMYWW